MSRELLNHAADLLEADAKTLSTTYRDWDRCPDAKADHDDLVTTANGLRALALAQQSIIETKEKRHA